MLSWVLGDLRRAVIWCTGRKLNVRCWNLRFIKEKEKYQENRKRIEAEERQEGSKRIRLEFSDVVVKLNTFLEVDEVIEVIGGGVMEISQLNQGKFPEIKYINKN